MTIVFTIALPGVLNASYFDSNTWNDNANATINMKKFVNTLNRVFKTSIYITTYKPKYGYRFKCNIKENHESKTHIAPACDFQSLISFAVGSCFTWYIINGKKKKNAYV